MTREEAIVDIRDNIKPVVGGKSLDMAIKALEQEPILDDVSRLCKSSEYCSNKCPLYDDVVNVGVCLFNYDPCDWDVKKIKDAMRKDKDYERD